MTQRPNITVSTPADLIAAIPALLGYVPTESLVCIAMTPDTTIRFTTRTAFSDTAAQAHILADTATRHGIELMILVAISTDRSAALDVRDEAREVFEAAGLAIVGNFYIPTLTETSQALDLDTRERFDVDARNSEVAAHEIRNGRSIERSRDAIAARFTAADPIAPTTGHFDAARTLEELAAVIYADERPTVDLIARTAAIITTLDNRDAMARFTHYGNTNAREVIATVARRSTGDARVHALILTGFFAHLAGDGAAANRAYEAAAADCTGEPPRMLGLLTAALGAGMSPTEMRGVILDVDTVREVTGAYLPGQ